MDEKISLIRFELNKLRYENVEIFKILEKLHKSVKNLHRFNSSSSDEDEEEDNMKELDDLDFANEDDLESIIKVNAESDDDKFSELGVTQKAPTKFDDKIDTSTPVNDEKTANNTFSIVNRLHHQNKSQPKQQQQQSSEMNILLSSTSSSSSSSASSSSSSPDLEYFDNSSESNYSYYKKERVITSKSLNRKPKTGHDSLKLEDIFLDPNENLKTTVEGSVLSAHSSASHQSSNKSNYHKTSGANTSASPLSIDLADLSSNLSSTNKSSSSGSEKQRVNTSQVDSAIQLSSPSSRLTDSTLSPQHFKHGNELVKQISIRKHKEQLSNRERFFGRKANGDNDDLIINDLDNEFEYDECHTGGDEDDDRLLDDLKYEIYQHKRLESLNGRHQMRKLFSFQDGLNFDSHIKTINSNEKLIKKENNNNKNENNEYNKLSTVKIMNRDEDDYANYCNKPSRKPSDQRAAENLKLIRIKLNHRNALKSSATSQSKSNYQGCCLFDEKVGLLPTPTVLFNYSTYSPTPKPIQSTKSVYHINPKHQQQQQQKQQTFYQPSNVYHYQHLPSSNRLKQQQQQKQQMPYCNEIFYI